MTELFSSRRSSMLEQCLYAEKIFAHTRSGRIVERPQGIISSREINLTPVTYARMTKYAESLAGLVSIIDDDSGRNIFHFFMTDFQKNRLGIPMPVPADPPFPVGSLLRFDSVFTGDPSFPIRVCDVNATLLGYAVQRRLAEMTTGLKKLNDPVACSLGSQVMDQTNGIITDIHYRVIPHLCWLARRTQDMSGRLFRVISPAEYHKNIKGKHYNGDDDYGLLINMSREAIIARMVRKPTIYGRRAKLIETKLFPWLLPEIHAALGLEDELSPLAERIAIPSCIVASYRYPSETNIVKRSHGLLTEKPLTPYEIESFLAPITGPQHFRCVLKTVASSGSKGVRTVKGKSWKDLAEKITRQASSMSDDTFRHSDCGREIIVLQPYYESVSVFRGKHFRVKMDTFVLRQQDGWSAIGSGLQIKPINNDIVHGGKDTGIMVVADSWEK